jgi:hypothetical protein
MQLVPYCGEGVPFTNNYGIEVAGFDDRFMPRQ